MSDPQTALEINTKLKEPPMYKVIYMNDNETSMHFVIESLIKCFGYTFVVAEKITNEIHTEGAACAAILPFEIAEQKGIEIMTFARKEGYPLQIKIEEENKS